MQPQSIFLKYALNDDKFLLTCFHTTDSCRFAHQKTLKKIDQTAPYSFHSQPEIIENKYSKEDPRFFEEFEKQFFSKLIELKEEVVKDKEIHYFILVADVNLGNHGGAITKFLFNYDLDSKEKLSIEKIFPQATIYRFFESANPECVEAGKQYAKEIGLEKGISFNVKGEPTNFAILPFLSRDLENIQEGRKQRKETEEKIREDLSFFQTAFVNKEPKKNASTVAPKVFEVPS